MKMRKIAAMGLSAVMAASALPEARYTGLCSRCRTAVKIEFCVTCLFFVPYFIIVVLISVPLQGTLFSKYMLKHL